MRKLLSIFVLFVALVAPTLGNAAGELRRYSSYGRVINAVALDASSSTFAINFDQADQRGVWGLMVVWVCVPTDANNSVTAIAMSVTASRDNGTTDYVLQDCTTSSGACTSSSASWSKDPSSMTTKCWPWRVDIEGFPEVEATLTDTGGTADDTLTVYVTLATKGG